MSGADGMLWLVVPQGVDDPTRVSGGNVFDQRVREGLRDRGWQVRAVEVEPDPGTRLAEELSRVPTEAVVLVDGLVAMRAAGVIEAAAGRLRIVVLAHMVVGAFAGADARDIEGEARVLSCARRVIVPSEWVRSEFVERGRVAPERVVVAMPGSDDAPEARGTATGGALLCIGVVAPHKGQDTLVDALVQLGSRMPWTCTIAGSVAVDPGFAGRVAARAEGAGLSERITWAGVLTPIELDAEYARADLLVAPSRTESYGIAVAEALRRGVPVLASRVGGIPEAVRPGVAAVLVPPDRPDALSDALRRWIIDPTLRARLTDEARRTRTRRPRWSDTVDTIDATLAGLS
ncbi:glycosyltransferase family 4 protein [Micromonospora sp. DT81.3]|uniref:glycosyltransferase family 4 protein n=1 Tax=Micromonospora sp. DT81.3 TaxID=3416523 RepID=UPI003CEAC213